MLWSKDVDGQISRINVNQNGFVSVIVSGTSYKSVISTFSENGQEIFKTFLSTTVAVLPVKVVVSLTLVIAPFLSVV